jgi:DNA-binding IclR family transcriptional regulator
MSSTNPRTARSGTQSLERAVLLLREIASRSHAGWGLRDLAQHCELDHGTVHRMLKCMVAQGLVQQRASDSRYFLGPLNFELGLSVPHRQTLMDAVQAALKGAARMLPKTAAVAFLRSGNECVCIGRAGHLANTRAEGNVRLGQRLPLLATAGSVAIVAAMRADEARGVCARNRKRLAHLGAAHLTAVDELVKASQRQGYTLSEGVVWHRVNTLALAFGPAGAPLGSISVSAWSEDQSTEAMRKRLAELRAITASLAADAARGS